MNCLTPARKGFILNIKFVKIRINLLIGLILIGPFYKKKSLILFFLKILILLKMIGKEALARTIKKNVLIKIKALKLFMTSKQATNNLILI